MCAALFATCFLCLEVTMKNVFYYIGIGLILIAVSCGTRADTLQDLQNIIKDKVVIHEGGCHLDANGEVVTKEKATRSLPCIAGVDPKVSNIHYILLLAGDQPLRMVKFDFEASKQLSIIWRAGTSL